MSSTIRLVTNSVSPNQVTETDDAFIIEDVPFHRPKENLDGGYTPKSNVEQTAPGWAGVPVTLFHVRDDRGKPVAAHKDPAKHVGEVREPAFDGEFVRAGKIVVRKDDLDRLGGRGEQIREALANGKTIEVSSQYAGSSLPAGEYDGDYRTNAAAIVRPDSVAILPEGSGRCSIEDGCGINPQLAANADLTVPMTDDPQPDGEDLGNSGGESVNANQDLALTSVGPGDVDGYTDDEWNGSSVTADLPNPSDDDDAAAILDATHLVHPTGDEARQSKANWKLPFRDGSDAPVNTRALVAIDAALSGARGGVDGVSGDLSDRASDRVESLLEEATDDLFGTTANSAIEWLVNAAASLVPGADSTANQTTGAESPADPDNPSMGDKTQELVENHGFDAENLPGEDTECFSRIYEQFAADDAGGSGGSKDPDEPSDGGAEDGADVVEMTEEKLMERVDARAEEKAEKIAANREAEREKSELASTIVANSAEYDDADDVIEDFPTVASLETKKEQVTESGGIPGTGATADFAANADDDLTEDVSAGVFE